MARTIRYPQGIAKYTGNLAGLALRREDWEVAETLAQQVLLLSDKIGRQDLIDRGGIRAGRIGAKGA